MSVTTRFTLYYWPIPFRGCFVSYLFAYRDHPLAMAGADDVAELRARPPGEQPVPFIGPPVLWDREANLYLSQMPAIVPYVARVLELFPKTPADEALAMKVLMDCNDVLMEICNYNGSKMWTPEAWRSFRGERLPRWMQIFESSLDRGFIGTDAPHYGDIGTFALFGTMTRCLPELAADLKAHAPGVFDLCERIGAQPSLKRFRDAEEAEFGQRYCGGQIEASIRAMLAADGLGAAAERA